MGLRTGLFRAACRALAIGTLPLLPACGQDAGSVLNLSATGSIPATDAAAEHSGHPLMSPQAILSAAANFSQCVGGFRQAAAQRGVSPAQFDALTRGLEPDLEIMKLMDRQPEFSRPVWEYLETLVNDRRIAAGREMLALHRATFDRVERVWGVDRHILAAIWGVESNFGTITGDRPVIRSTATLACVGRRQDYFKEEFLSALEIVARGDVPAEQFRGSWAGAFGQTQFMPTSFKRHAVDGDGDERRNIIGSVADALASTANMLKKSGWHTGATWGYEVILPEGFNFMLAGADTRKSLGEWERLGVRRAGGQTFPRPADRGHLLLPAGGHGPAFVAVDNFRVVMRYNPSEYYALAVGHLADRLRGGEAFAQSWPRNQLPLSRGERFEMQERLARLGLYRGTADGIVGRQTRAAVRDFQSRANMIPDGFASSTVLERLRQAR